MGVPFKCFSHFQVDPAVMCIKQFRRVTRSSAVWGANQKSSSCFLLTSNAEVPLAQAEFVLSAPIFLSGKERPISCCLHYTGRMALIFSGPGLPRPNALGHKEMVTTNENLGPNPPTHCQPTTWGISCSRRHSAAGGTEKHLSREHPPELSHLRKLLPYSGKLSQSCRAKQSPVLSEALKICHFLRHIISDISD